MNEFADRQTAFAEKLRPGRAESFVLRGRALAFEPRMVPQFGSWPPGEQVPLWMRVDQFGHAREAIGVGDDRHQHATAGRMQRRWIDIVNWKNLAVEIGAFQTGR